MKLATTARVERESLAREIQRRLTEEYPDAHCELDHRNPFELAVATILSAQCTDKRVNLVTPELAGSLGRSLREAAAAAGRTPPRLAAWAVAAVDPTAETRAQLAQGVVPYLGAEGYGEMFEAAGFGELVAAARAGTHPRELLARVPDELAASVGMVGSAEQAARRAAAYREAGVDDLVLVPATAGDDAGARTLRALRHLGD